MWNMGAMSFLRSAGASWPKTHIEALQIAHEGRRFAMKVLDQRITRCIKHGPSFPKGPSFSSIVKSNWMMNYPSSPWLGLQSIRNHPSVLTSLLGVLLAPILAITRKWHDAPWGVTPENRYCRCCQWTHCGRENESKTNLWSLGIKASGVKSLYRSKEHGLC